MSDLVEALVWCGAAIAAIAGLVTLLGYFAYRTMIRYRMRDEAYQRQAGLESGDFDASVFDLPWVEENVASKGGYPLRTHALEPERADGRGGPLRLAVFHHGIGWGWLGMIRYMMMFRAEGWTVVAYDARGHGLAKGGSGPRPARPSYGYFEKEDLKTVVDWTFATFGGNQNAERGARFAGGRIASGVSGGLPGAELDERFSGGRPPLVVFGESMGAATALQYAPLDDRVDAVVADCPFSSAMDELESQLGRGKVPRPFRRLAARIADAFCRRIEGFSLRDADSSRAILETDVPILFIHGLEDRFVPWSMSVAMAERRRRALPDAVTELLLVPEARHGQSARVDPARYLEALRDFLEKALDRGRG